VQTTAVFDGSLVPEVGDILQLHIGAPDPSRFGTTYSRCPPKICTQSQYEIWSKNTITDYASAFDENTIFKVTDPTTGEVLLLSNTKSIVSLGGGHAFRNAPMYNSPVDPTQRDGLYETDEILRVYAQHPNTGKFSCIRSVFFYYVHIDDLLTLLLCWSNFLYSSLHRNKAYPKSCHFEPESSIC
jgi:hypothetical protein